MAAFKGMVRLVDDTASLPATLELAHGSLTVSSGDTELGCWELADLAVEEHPGGFVVSVEGERLLVSPLDRRGFAGALAAATPRRGPEPRKRGRRARSSRAEPTTGASPGAAEAVEPEERGRSRRRRRSRPDGGQVAPAVAPDPVAEAVEPEERGRFGRRRRRRSDGGQVAPAVAPDPVAEAVEPEVRGRFGRRRRSRPDGEAGPGEPDPSIAAPTTARTSIPARTTAPPSPAQQATESEGRRAVGGRIAGIVAASSLRQRLVVIGSVVVVALAVFAPTILALALLVVGGAALLAGTLAFLDPYTAVRIPAPWTAQRLMAVGGVLLAVAIVVPLLL